MQDSIREVLGESILSEKDVDNKFDQLIGCYKGKLNQKVYEIMNNRQPIDMMQLELMDQLEQQQ